ncbi:MAG: UPF0182 family protein [Coriobacteriia bacterium]|nr:UPF0182 family protein [Coriobacteriia bacterium]
MAASRSRWITVLVSVGLFFVFVGLPLLAWAAGVWTDYLWYAELGQEQVFWTRIWAQLAVGLAFGLATFAVLFTSLRVARALAPRFMPTSLPEGMPPQLELVIERLRAGIGPLLDRMILWGSVVLAFLNGAGMSQSWEVFRLATSGVSFGATDPQFGVDIGFFVFSLPALELTQAWLNDVLILTTILTLAVHVVGGSIQPWARLKGFAPHVKAHLSVLLAALVASRAFAYWIDIYNLNFSPRGQVVGASYTDVTAQLPAYRILIGISIAVIVLLLVNIRYRGWRLPAIALGVWIGAAILLGGVWPAVVQALVVSPNEASLEKPYIERNIAMTRSAFGLTEVEGRSFPAADDLSVEDVRANAQTLSNVRLWDPAIVKQSYRQLQTIRPYYEFGDVDVDRYLVNGVRRQLLVSAREMNSSLLADTAQTWVNRHLVYTHGFGLVMSPSSEYDSRGLPNFIVGDIPPKLSSQVATGSPNLIQKEPRIYFGEQTTEYVVVNAGIDEFDYPDGQKNATHRYTGDAGVEIGSLGRRIAWALRLGSSQVLFSEYLKSDSRVLLKRDLNSRLEALAPWLMYEDDPYPVLADGRIIWVIDAYTASDSYPYSEKVGGVSYLRNSVKVTVDAYTGETTFYAFDSEDPVLAAWRSIFPTLLADADQVPEAIQEHFRYPEGLFVAQAEAFRTYHMTDPGVFYNKEDQWEIPGERQGEPMEPFFVLLQLPGADKEHFYLMQPYTPRNRDNMIGWMAASSDPENYGERTVFLFPKERVILGPEQVAARINQDSLISPQLSLWNQRGSSAIFGNMIVVPIEDSVIYVQPLFLQAEQTAIPELTRVVVVYADKVEMERTLAGALLKIFGAEPPASSATTGSPDASGTAAVDVTAAEALYREALVAQKAGNWALYGEKIAELGRVLQRLAGAETTQTP